MELLVRVIPGARRASVGGLRDGALLVRVTAPAREGRANEAVREALARAFSIRPSAVELIGGVHDRRKRLRLEGDPEALASRLRELEGAEQRV